MDPPLISEGSFSTVNPSLAEIWPFGGGGGSGGVVGLGLRMGSGGGFGQGFVGGFVGGSGGSGGGGSVEESTVTEQSGSHGGGGGGGRKRRGAISEDEESKLVSSTSSGNELKQSNGKRMKILGSRDENMGLKSVAESSCAHGNKLSKKSDQLAEPPKDYIHVRARRGQATDNHSLAERARREKISERMKILQDLVPGCNKAVGKALVLDEIINYIQSLQRQVEFLSMKLEAVNAAIFPTLNAFHSKDVNQLEGPSFESNGMIMSPQAAREYSAGPHHEWLHMQLSSAFERAS